MENFRKSYIGPAILGSSFIFHLLNFASKIRKATRVEKSQQVENFLKAKILKNIFIRYLSTDEFLMPPLKSRKEIFYELKWKEKSFDENAET